MMRLVTCICVLTIGALCVPVVSMAARERVQSQRQSVIRAVDNKATLRSGVSIELLGLTYIPAKGQPWWQPDGSPVDEPSFDRVGTDPSVDSNWEQFNYYAVATRLKGKPVAKLGQAKWLFRKADGHAHTTYYDKNVLAGLVRFPKYVKTTTLRLGIVGGDWQTLITFKDYGSYRKGKDSIVVSRPYGHLGPLGSGLGEKGLYIRVVYNVTDRDVRIVAVDKNGKVHLSNSGGSGGTSELRRTIANFRDLTQDKLQEYRFDVREYEWVEFRNIALRPGQEAVARAERKRAIEQEKLEQWLGEGQTRRIREQILTLRESYHIHEPCNSQVAAISAIQELVRIGAPAVPELITELRQTERRLYKSLIAFTLRAIGDRRAVPGLIEVLGRSKYRGGYGVYVKDDELASFMLQHQHTPPDDGDRKAKQVIIAGPVIEIVKALEKITGHSEGPDRFSPEAAEVVKRRWQRWWQQQNKRKTDVQVESKTDSLDQLGDAPEEVRAIGKMLSGWFNGCVEGDLEQAKKAYLPSKSNNAKHDLQRMKQLLEVAPNWQFSLLGLMWDENGATAVSHKISHPGADSPLVFVWQLKKFEGQWRIADQFGGGRLNEFRNLEEFLNYLDRYVFCQEYPTGYMWLDTADPNLRLRTNSRKSEAASFAKSHWPQLDGAPEQVQQIAKVLKRWFAACLAEDAEQIKELYRPNTQRHAEDKLKDMNRILAMAPGWWFSPMMIKFSKSEADAISHPMEKINFPGASDPMISIVRFKKVEGQWTILSSSMDGLRSLPDSYAYFYRRYPDGQIWFDKSIPDWLKPDQQTGVDVDIEELKGISEKVKPNYSLAEKIRAINGEKEIFESYFPDDAEAGKKLDEYWQNRKNVQIEPEVFFELFRKGLRRCTAQYKGNFLMQHIGGKYIWRKEPDDKRAVDIVYHASFSPEYAYYAVYSGLSVARPKSEKVLKRLVELCMANVNVGRIVWGTKGQHKDMLVFLEPYLASSDLEIKERAIVLEKVFKGEIDYGQWAKEQRRQKLQAEFGEKLPEIREVLLRGNSHQRRELFALIGRNGLHILFDESFVEPLKACLKDGDPSVREAAIEYGGDLFGKRGECSDEMLEVMNNLSKDWDHKVREAVAVFVGSHWIWGVEPQNPKAIEIMMRLSKDKDREVREAAVYYGLSVVENKSDKVIKRLIEMALDAGASSNLGRIGWGLGRGADKEKIKMYLMPYLEPGNRKGERARQLYREMFKAEPPNSPKEETKENGLVVKTSALQSLIDSAQPGDTVIVPKGVYTEPIEINKSLTLKGQSRAACVFEVTADKPAIFIDTKGKGRVTIEAVTIKWQLATDDKSEYYFAVGVKDSKAEVKNCSFVPLSNFKRSPVAIQAIGFSNLTINTCRFEGFEYTVCYGEGTEGTIQDSLVMGSGHQGISLYSGATVKIIRNVVTGSKYHGVRSTGGTLDMKDNLIIENANRGVYLGNKSAHGTITNNIITGNRLVGISGFAQSDVKIYNNLILNSGQVGIGAQPSCRFLVKDNIIKGNPSGIVVFLKEGARRGNLLIRRNTFWNNDTDTENCEKAPGSISEEPVFRDPANGDFSLTGGKVMEQKQGLTDPKVFKALWKRWKNRADKTDVSVDVEVEAALGWLKLVDDEDYAKSFDEMAALFRGSGSKTNWEETMDHREKGFGKVVSRKVSSKRRTRYLPTGPAGEYVIIEFESSFEYKSKAAETVTLMREKDGVWRVTRYFIE